MRVVRLRRERGWNGQAQRRELEALVRRRTVAYARWARVFHGLDLKRAAQLIGMAPQTLRSWIERLRERPEPAPRGKPPGTLSRETRQLLMFLLWLMGPQTGVATLAQLLPQVPRGEIAALLRRYRQEYWANRQSTTHVLRWDQRGAVWAMDFSDPEAAIDGQYRSVLHVRDLASGKQLASLPVTSSSAENVEPILEALFQRHGPPLVMKSDNGGHFLTDDLDRLLARWGVERLLSPPEWPRYNGACEAGIGSIKTRAHHIAARNGRPGHWTCDDVEEARLQANATARPLGAGSPTPDELWTRRASLEGAERGTFRRSVRMYQWEVIRELNRLPGFISTREQAQINREAVTRALVHHGYLRIVRRRFNQPVPRRFRANIV